MLEVHWGKEPKVGLKLPHLINPSDALFYIEGMIEFFKSEGDYKNKHKSKNKLYY